MTNLQKVIKYFALALAICIIISIFSLILSVLNSLGVSVIEKDSKVVDAYIINDDINDMDISLNSSDLSIIWGDNLGVDSTSKSIDVKIEGNILKISEKNSLFWDRNSKVTITIPRRFYLNSVDIDSGAGSILIEDINTKELDLDLAAGKVDINNINVLNDTEIDGGAGKLTMDNVTLSNLKLSLGAGSSKITGVFKGNSEIECSVGGLDLTLLDSINNYALDIDKAIGKVYVNSRKITDEKYTTNGENPLKIEGAVGSINIVTND